MVWNGLEWVVPLQNAWVGDLEWFHPCFSPSKMGTFSFAVLWEVLEFLGLRVCSILGVWMWKSAWGSSFISALLPLSQHLKESWKSLSSQRHPLNGNLWHGWSSGNTQTAGNGQEKVERRGKLSKNKPRMNYLTENHKLDSIIKNCLSPSEHSLCTTINQDHLLEVLCYKAALLLSGIND